MQRTVLDEQTGTIEFESPKPSLTGAAEPKQPSGRAALAEALRDVRFPTKKQDLISSVGERTIEFRRGQPIRMREALERTTRGEFSSLLDAAHEIHRALDERRQERRSSTEADP